MRKPVPVGGGHELDEVALDLDRVVLARQAKSLRDTTDMRVDHHSLSLTELGGDDVCGLTRHAGQPKQLGDRPRDNAVELIEQHPHRAANRLRLLSIKAGLENVLLQLLDGHGQIVLRPPVLDEQLRRDAIHVHVGRLRGEHHRDEQLDIASEVQRDLGVRMLDRESLDDRPDPLAPRSDPAAACFPNVASRHACPRTPLSPLALKPRPAPMARRSPRTAVFLST